jgi:hypothetical protein
MEVDTRVEEATVDRVQDAAAPLVSVMDTDGQEGQPWKAALGPRGRSEPAKMRGESMGRGPRAKRGSENASRGLRFPWAIESRLNFKVQGMRAHGWLDACLLACWPPDLSAPACLLPAHGRVAAPVDRHVPAGVYENKLA